MSSTIVNNNSFSLIEWGIIYLQINLMLILLVVNVISDITDHFTQFCIVRSLTVIGKNEKCSFCYYSHIPGENFLHDLSQIDRQTLISEGEPNVDKLFSVLYTTLNKVGTVFQML